MENDTQPGDLAGATPQEQLAAIADVGRLLDGAGVQHWLFGGWGVDFWVGRVTRPHDDVDLAVRRDDGSALHAALVGNGWLHTPFEDEVVGTRYVRAGVLLELTFVVDEGGRVVIPFEPEAAVWSEQPFGDARQTLDGVTARVPALEIMVRDKRRPRVDDEHDEAKDRADYEALSRIDGGA
ncbi:hypothetical protein ASH01_06615 [Terrabacter sp. Soil811]|uniref:nucleotidyltransferase domain-containing protein n=1 Tax=Terrabacter sp. Soil811 TaxID=1736419 RepID=UPI000701F064|nr:hypothetical protein [Terrabacter sp. Soil811]KRF45495.1 hypothetical protein ASH01_06615 [Terrabacter sp. Soil811]